ncbi:MAG: hypothetical protein ABIT37_21380 [Luteolibacter sp.]
MRLDDVPYWLIEISTSPNATSYDLRKLLPIDSVGQGPTEQEFLGAMAVRFIDHHDSLCDLLPLMYDRFCSCEWTEMTATRQEIYVIDDEFDWDRTRATKTAHGFLEQFLAGGIRLIEEIKSEQTMDDNPH